MKKKIKKLKKQLNKNNKSYNYRDQIEKELFEIQAKLAMQDKQKRVNRQPFQFPEERLIHQLNRQDQNDLKLLSDLPKNSELYHQKLDQYQQAAQARMRMEAQMNELKLQRFRNEINQQSPRQQSFIKPRPQQGQYSPEIGFTIYWDYVTGIPRRYQFAQVVYSILERGQQRIAPRLVQATSLDPDPYSELTGIARFGYNHQIMSIPAYPQINCIIEVQVLNRRPGNSQTEVAGNIGWTPLDLFNFSYQLNEGVWKVPLYKPPTDMHFDFKHISSLVPIPNGFVYIRVANNAGSNPYITDLPVIPHETQNRYIIPASHSRDQIVMAAPLTDSPPDTPVPQTKGVPKLPIKQKPVTLTGNIGIGVKVIEQSGMSLKSPLQITIYLQIGSSLVPDFRGGNCMWSSDRIILQKTGRDLNNRRIPGTDVQLQDIGFNPIEGYDGNETTKNPIQLTHCVINTEMIFYNDFIHLLDQNDWKDQIQLIIEVRQEQQQYSQTQSAMISQVNSDGFTTVAWSVLQLSNPEVRDIQWGSMHLNLFKPPIQVPVTDPTLLKPTGGHLNVIIFNPKKHEPIQPNRTAFETRDLHEAFIENTSPQYDDSFLFERGDGVDFYVDGARFLPDNASCTKIIVRAYTSVLDKVGIPVGGLPDLDSFSYLPSFGFRTEYREHDFDPTTIVVVTLITIDAQLNEVRILGYSAINLFLDRYRKNFTTQPNERDYILNSGSFQIPIYCQEPYRKPPFSMSSFNRLEHIPCATLLVRIRLASKVDGKTVGVKEIPPNEWYIRNVVVPPPQYEDRAYNTQSCMPSNAERFLYQSRLDRNNIQIREATRQIMQQVGDTRDLFDEEMLKWIDEKLKITARTPIFEVKYFAKYSSRMGFKISVDAIHNLPSPNPHVVIYSLNPPASIYKGVKNDYDVQFTNRFNWDSSIMTPQFTSGFYTFKNQNYNPQLHVIFDVRQIKITGNVSEVVQIGWTIFPIFDAEGYVNSGNFQIPLFKGELNEEMIGKLLNNKPWDNLIGLYHSNIGLELLQPVSIIMRLVDVQREGHFSIPLEITRMDYSLIPSDLMSKFVYNSAASAQSSQARRYKTIIPGKETNESYLRKINAAVIEELGQSNFRL